VTHTPPPDASPPDESPPSSLSSSRQRTSAQCVTGSAKRVGAAFVSAEGASSVSVSVLALSVFLALALLLVVSVSDLALASAFELLLLRETPSTVHSSAGLGGRIPARSRDAALARRGTGSSATHVRASHPRPRAAATKSAAASSCVAAREWSAKHSRSVGEVLELSRAASIAAERLAVGFGWSSGGGG